MPVLTRVPIRQTREIRRPLNRDTQFSSRTRRMEPQIGSGACQGCSGADCRNCGINPNNEVRKMKDPSSLSALDALELVAGKNNDVVSDESVGEKLIISPVHTPKTYSTNSHLVRITMMKQSNIPSKNDSNQTTDEKGEILFDNADEKKQHSLEPKPETLSSNPINPEEQIETETPRSASEFVANKERMTPPTIALSSDERPKDEAKIETKPEEKTLEQPVVTMFMSQPVKTIELVGESNLNTTSAISHGVVPVPKNKEQASPVSEKTESQLTRMEDMKLKIVPKEERVELKVQERISTRFFETPKVKARGDLSSRSSMRRVENPGMLKKVKRLRARVIELYSKIRGRFNPRIIRKLKIEIRKIENELRMLSKKTKLGIHSLSNLLSKLKKILNKKEKELRGEKESQKPNLEKDKKHFQNLEEKKKTLERFLVKLGVPRDFAKKLMNPKIFRSKNKLKNLVASLDKKHKKILFKLLSNKMHSQKILLLLLGLYETKNSNTVKKILEFLKGLLGK